MGKEKNGERKNNFANSAIDKTQLVGYDLFLVYEKERDML